MTENIEKRVPKGDIKFSITLSDEQKQAKQSILQHPFNFIMGKAGSGKTLLACQIALDSFFKRDYNKIVVTRPTVSNEDNGFLPGTLEEKLEPWLVPIRSNMRKVYDKSSVLDKMMRRETRKITAKERQLTAAMKKQEKDKEKAMADEKIREAVLEQINIRREMEGVSNGN